MLRVIHLNLSYLLMIPLVFGSGCSKKDLNQTAESNSPQQSNLPNPVNSSLTVLPLEGADVASFQIFSGTCQLDGDQIVVTSASQIDSIGGVTSSAPCIGGAFNIGLMIWADSGTQHELTFTQGTNAVVRKVKLAATGFGRFTQGVNGIIYTMLEAVAQAKFYVGGEFTLFDQVNAPHFARLNSDGTVDPAFNSGNKGTDGSVYTAIFNQTKDKIYLGGRFNTYNGQVRRSVVRINLDGSIDPQFTPIDLGAGSLVVSLGLDSTHDQIYVGGSFEVSDGGASWSGVLRLNSDGSLDPSFAGLGGVKNGASPGIVDKLLVTDSDSKVYIGGEFTNYNSVNRNYLVRVNRDGSIDSTFNQSNGGINGRVNALAVDGITNKLYIGGQFTTVESFAHHSLARLNANGSIDSSFAEDGQGFNYHVYDIVIVANGAKLLVGGGFVSYGTASVNFIAQLNTDGTLDSAFNSIGNGPNLPVMAILVNQGASKIYLGGQFSEYNSVHRTSLARTDLSGGLDSSWLLPKNGLSSTVRYLSYVPPFDTVFVSGMFLNYHSNSHYGNLIATAQGDESPSLSIANLGLGDSSFGDVTTTADQASVYISGWDSNPAPQYGMRIVRVNASQTIDTSFVSQGTGFNGWISSIEPIGNTGKIFVGGYFSHYNLTQTGSVARLNSDGTIDNSFSLPGSGFDQYVNHLGWDNVNSKLYVAGNFTNLDGTSQPYLVRLNSDGSRDATFVAVGGGFNGEIYKLIIDSQNQKIYVAGKFTAYGTTVVHGLARLNLDGSYDTSFTDLATENFGEIFTMELDSENQRLYIGGSFGEATNANLVRHLARLKLDGSIDSSFAAQSDGFNGPVYSLSLDRVHQKIYVGGDFTSYFGTIQNYLTKLNFDGSLSL